MNEAETLMSMYLGHLIFDHSIKIDKRGISPRLPIGVKRDYMFKTRNHGKSFDAHRVYSVHFCFLLNQRTNHKKIDQERFEVLR